MFGACSRIFLTAVDLNFLGCSFDEVLLSWNMFSDFSEPTKAGIFCRGLGMHLWDRNPNVTLTAEGGRKTAPPYLSRISPVGAYAFNF